jgi:thioesterase domain-containing protein
MAAHLPFPCIGVRYQGADVSEDLNVLGRRYAEVILKALNVFWRRANISNGRGRGHLVRLGGYSYGCRIAYAAAEWLEAQTLRGGKRRYDVEVVLLDGAIDGAVPHSQLGAIRRFATELYMRANGAEDLLDLDETQRNEGGRDAALDRVVAALTTIEEGNQNATPVMDPLMKFMLSHSNFLRRHLTIVETLCSAADGYVASYRLQGRALRIVSEKSGESDPPDFSTTTALADDLTVVHSVGGHFDFFRVEALKVAAAIEAWVALGRRGEV